MICIGGPKLDWNKTYYLLALASKQAIEWSVLMDHNLTETKHVNY